MVTRSEQVEKSERSFASEEDKIGTKRKPIHYIFFWTAGIATLFLWNCMLSLTGYLKTRVDKTVDDYYGFCFNFGGFIAFFLIEKVERIVSLRFLQPLRCRCSRNPFFLSFFVDSSDRYAESA